MARTVSFGTRGRVGCAVLWGGRPPLRRVSDPPGADGSCPAGPPGWSRCRPSAPPPGPGWPPS